MSSGDSANIGPWNGGRSGKMGKNRGGGTRQFFRGKPMDNSYRQIPPKFGFYGNIMPEYNLGFSTDASFNNRIPQFGEMDYSRNFSNMEGNYFSYPLNYRFMGYQPGNANYHPYNAPPSFEFGRFRFSSQNFNGFNHPFGREVFGIPPMARGINMFQRRGNRFPFHGFGRGGHFSQPKQGKRKKQRKSDDIAAPKDVVAKKPWFDEETVKLLKEKIKAHKRMKRSPTDENVEAFKDLRKEVRRLSRQNYNDYCIKSGIPNKFIEAAKAKKQKAEEAAAAKAEENKRNTKQGEEHENSVAAVIGNENSNNERQENETTIGVIGHDIENENSDSQRQENETSIGVIGNGIENENSNSQSPTGTSSSAEIPVCQTSQENAS